MQTSLRWTPDDYDIEKSADFRRPIYLYILKVASRCNLDCTYCYVYQSPDKSWQTKPKFLAVDILQKIAERIQEHVSEHGLSEISIVFHGGEPLLAGVERLESYTEIISSTISCKVKYGMQTNGILIDDAIIDFLHQHQFRVGISLDGTKENNDKHRIFPNGKSSYEQY